MRLKYKQWNKKFHIYIVKSRPLNKGTNEWGQSKRVQTNTIKLQTTRSKICIYIWWNLGH